MTSTVTRRAADPEFRPLDELLGGQVVDPDGQQPPTDAHRRRKWRQLSGTARWDETEHHGGQ